MKSPSTTLSGNGLVTAPVRPADQRVTTLLDVRLAAAKQSRRFEIGFPGATDIVYPELADWMTTQLLNNLGDPGVPGYGRDHTKDLEIEVVEMVAQLLRAPATWWGYVTSGSSEATEHALDDAARRYPDVVVYTSTAAHPSVSKAARRLRLPLVLVHTRPDDSIDVNDLAGELSQRRDRAAIIVATAGTTMTEAVDDVAAITAVCERLSITRRRIHVDAALSGIPLALLPVEQRPAFDFTSGATSMGVSGHKFLSTLVPCAVLIYAAPPHALTAAERNPYAGTADSTISGSRSGHTTLLLWSSLTRYGADGHRARAESARQVAQYAVAKLHSIGWQAWRNPHAFTVVLPTPPAVVRAKWVLATDGEWSHIVTMPGITTSQIDEFVADLAATMPTRPLPFVTECRLPALARTA